MYIQIRDLSNSSSFILKSNSIKKSIDSRNDNLTNNNNNKKVLIQLELESTNVEVENYSIFKKLSRASKT